jgi:hypothetical protein
MRLSRVEENRLNKPVIKYQPQALQDHRMLFLATTSIRDPKVSPALEAKPPQKQSSVHKGVPQLRQSLATRSVVDTLSSITENNNKSTKAHLDQHRVEKFGMAVAVRRSIIVDYG